AECARAPRTSTAFSVCPARQLTVQQLRRCGAWLPRPEPDERHDAIVPYTGTAEGGSSPRPLHSETAARACSISRSIRVGHGCAVEQPNVGKMQSCATREQPRAALLLGRCIRRLPLVRVQ